MNSQTTIAAAVVSQDGASGLVTALASNYVVLMAGRALVGVVIGGFWSLSAATVMRLVPAADVPRGLAILNGGNALATIIAAPLGSFLGQYIGWRGAFFTVVPLAALALVWLYLTLPAMPNAKRADGLGLARVVAERHRWPAGAVGLHRHSRAGRLVELGEQSLTR